MKKRKKQRRAAPKKDPGQVMYEHHAPGVAWKEVFRGPWNG